MLNSRTGLRFLYNAHIRTTRCLTTTSKLAKDPMDNPVDSSIASQSGTSSVPEKDQQAGSDYGSTLASERANWKPTMKPGEMRNVSENQNQSEEAGIGQATEDPDVK